MKLSCYGRHLTAEAVKQSIVDVHKYCTGNTGHTGC